MKLSVNRAFVMLRVHSLALVEQRLVPRKKPRHSCFVKVRLRHRVTGFGNLRGNAGKALRQIVKHRTVPRLVARAELAGIADTTVFIARDSAVKPILIRPHQHIDKGGLAAAVAADQRTVPPRLKAK